MSGYFCAIHGGTHHPILPVPPVGPASTATFWSVMYFFLRSSWAQFSTTASTSPVANPCQATSSFRSFLVTVQPSSLCATSAMTAALAS